MLFMTVRNLHILAGIWFTCGVSAYICTRFAMVKTQDVRGVQALVEVTGRFRDIMIRPGGMLLVIFGLWTAYYESWPHFAIHAVVLLVILVPFVVLTIRGEKKIVAACTEAVQAGSITPALNAAMRDRQTIIGEVGASIITFLFLLLMLIKPS